MAGTTAALKIQRVCDTAVIRRSQLRVDRSIACQIDCRPKPCVSVYLGCQRPMSLKATSSSASSPSSLCYVHSVPMAVCSRSGWWRSQWLRCRFPRQRLWTHRRRVCKALVCRLFHWGAVRCITAFFRRCHCHRCNVTWSRDPPVVPVFVDAASDQRRTCKAAAFGT